MEIIKLWRTNQWFPRLRKWSKNPSSCENEKIAKISDSEPLSPSKGRIIPDCVFQNLTASQGWRDGAGADVAGTGAQFHHQKPRGKKSQMRCCEVVIQVEVEEEEETQRSQVLVTGLLTV